MPSPVGHALGGLIVGLALDRRPPAPGERQRVEGSTVFRPRPTVVRRPSIVPGAATSLPVISAAVACLPDLDFLWGRHNMETHSIGFAVLVGVAIYVWQRSPRLALACALGVTSHVFFDWLGSDDTPPLGVMALWPFSNAFYFADAFVFEAISRRYWLPNSYTHNLLAVVREIAILLPVVVLVRFVRARRN